MPQATHPQPCLPKSLLYGTSLRLALVLWPAFSSRAAQLLEQEAGQVSEIACQVGYLDVDHFSKMFKQPYGVVPSAYGRADA